MKKFIRLFDFEMGRFLKFLLPTFLIVAVAQLYSTFSNIIRFNNDVQLAIAQGMDSQSLPIFSAHRITESMIFSTSIMGIVLVFVFYSFFIWYREWLGKNAFIYRLLMLPVERIYIFLTKALTFLVGGFLSLAFQFGMYAIVLFISERMVEAERYHAVTIHNIQPAYDLFQHILFPESGYEFIGVYGFAFAALITLFAAILMERSFNLKGLIAGVFYFAAFFIAYSIVSVINRTDVLPVIITPSQAYFATIAYLFVMITLGTLISRYLLKHKIKV